MAFISDALHWFLSQEGQAAGTWLLGIAGAVFVWRQNGILQQQSQIMGQQNAIMNTQTEMMRNQRDLNEILIQREKQRDQDQLKEWCKNAFRHSGSAGGILQSVGQSLRRRFPDSVDLIVTAYEELTNQDPTLNLPPPYRFLELMDGVEPGAWPDKTAKWMGPRY